MAGRKHCAVQAPTLFREIRDQARKKTKSEQFQCFRELGIHRCYSISASQQDGPARGTGQLKCDGTRAENRFRLSAKWTSPFKTAGVSVQWTTSSRGVCISGSIAGYTMFRGSVKGIGYPLHWPISLSLPLPCVTVCHHNSTGVYM